MSCYSDSRAFRTGNDSGKLLDVHTHSICSSRLKRLLKRGSSLSTVQRLPVESGSRRGAIRVISPRDLQPRWRGSDPATGEYLRFRAIEEQERLADNAVVF